MKLVTSFITDELPQMVDRLKAAGQHRNLQRGCRYRRPGPSVFRPDPARQKQPVKEKAAEIFMVSRTN
jgi:hypothetical protein